VLSTGDELRAEGPLTPGTIRDANRPMVLACLREAGLEPIDFGIVRDDEDLITATMKAALERCDAVLTSGGVSVGDYDYVKAALDRLGSLHWRQVAIKPAKPLAFGVIGTKPVFGLPGNPASSFVSFELFARPALLALAGERQVGRPEVVARAGADFARRRDGRVHVDRVTVEWTADGYVTQRSGAQASNVLSATALANGLALVPDGDGIRAGEPVRVLLLDAPIRP
jgi:molybdenum cofactor synthesis domain-containing protein